MVIEQGEVQIDANYDPEGIESNDDLNSEKAFFQVLPRYGFKVRLEETKDEDYVVIADAKHAPLILKLYETYFFYDWDVFNNIDVDNIDDEEFKSVYYTMQSKYYGQFEPYEPTPFDFNCVAAGEPGYLEYRVENMKNIPEGNIRLWKSMVKTAYLRAVIDGSDPEDEDIEYLAKANAIDEPEFTPEALRILIDLHIQRIMRGGESTWGVSQDDT